MLFLGAAEEGSEPLHPSPVRSLPAPPTLPPEVLQTRPSAPPDLSTLPDPSLVLEQFRQLEQLLALPPEQLTRMRRTIESLERMNPSERTILLEKVRQFLSMHPELQADLARSAGRLSSTEKALLRQYWLGLTPEEREAQRRALHGLGPEQRREWERKILERLRPRAPETAPVPPEVRQTPD